MPTRKLTLIALLAALSTLLMVFISIPLIPAAPFLKLDLSFIPIFVGLMLLDLKSSYGILLLRSLLKLLIANAGINDYIGLPMNILGYMLLLFVLNWCLQQKNWRPWARQTTALILGTITLTIAMVLINYLYALPLYAQFANFNIQQIFGVWNYLLTIVVPFNLLEGVILIGLSLILLPAIQRIVRRVN